jgi:hypothetical protein
VLATIFFETIQDGKSILANAFDAVDVALDGTGTPVDGETGVYSQPIAMEVPAEAAQLRWAGAVDNGDPLIELGPTSFTDQDHESLGQSPA